MRVLIVDDEYIILKDQERIISKVLQEVYSGMTIQIDISSSSKEALELVKKNQYEIIFTDIDMPKMKGIEFCNLIEEYSPHTNVIYITGFLDYSLGAWKTFACGFLTKPLQEESIQEACNRLRYPIEKQEKVEIHCFGAFEILYLGKKVNFSRKKSLEMLAVLVDNLGTDTSIEKIRAYLWEEEEDSDEKKAYVRQLARDIRNTFSALGVEDLLINCVGGYYLNKEKVNCDYFNLIDNGGNKPSVYMAQYTWAQDYFE